jgi:hypothetical protein
VFAEEMFYDNDDVEYCPNITCWQLFPCNNPNHFIDFLEDYALRDFGSQSCIWLSRKAIMDNQIQRHFQSLVTKSLLFNHRKILLDPLFKNKGNFFLCDPF